MTNDIDELTAVNRDFVASVQNSEVTVTRAAFPGSRARRPFD
jgi:hypothetical protein